MILEKNADRRFKELPTKYIIINPFGIGDVLFTTPVIRAIKESQPNSFIAYWCNQRTSPILKSNLSIDKVFTLSRGDLKKIYKESSWKGILSSLKLFWSIKREHFDICLDFSLDHRYSLVSKLLGIKKRIGFNYRKRGRFLTDKIDIDGYNLKHIIEYDLDLLKFLNIEPKTKNLDLYVYEKNRLKSKKILERLNINDKDLIIGIAPGAGASWGRESVLKHWSAEKFAQLADKIIDKFGAKVLILGDESESSIADKIRNKMHNEAVDLVGKTSLKDLVAIIDNLYILITNDGGPLHMAVALGKKTVSFFGPVDPKVYGPYPSDEKRHIVLKKTLGCSPCYRNFQLSDCQNNRKCLEEIDVEQALAATSSLLSEKENI